MIFLAASFVLKFLGSRGASKACICGLEKENSSINPKKVFLGGYQWETGPWAALVVLMVGTSKLTWGKDL